MEVEEAAEGSGDYTADLGQGLAQHLGKLIEGNLILLLLLLMPGVPTAEGTAGRVDGSEWGGQGVEGTRQYLLTAAHVLRLVQPQVKETTVARMVGRTRKKTPSGHIQQSSFPSWQRVR